MTKKDKTNIHGKKKQMRKNILNFSYSELHSKLKYKAMLMEKLVISVDPKYTSQECSKCGKRQKLLLSQRIYSCCCGLNLPRDLNAAINIRNKGYKSFFEVLNPSSLALAA